MAEDGDAPAGLARRGSVLDLVHEIFQEKKIIPGGPAQAAARLPIPAKTRFRVMPLKQMRQMHAEHVQEVFGSEPALSTSSRDDGGGGGANSPGGPSDGVSPRGALFRSASFAHTGEKKPLFDDDDDDDDEVVVEHAVEDAKAREAARARGMSTSVPSASSPLQQGRAAPRPTSQGSSSTAASRASTTPQQPPSEKDDPYCLFLDPFAERTRSMSELSDDDFAAGSEALSAPLPLAAWLEESERERSLSFIGASPEFDRNRNRFGDGPLPRAHYRFGNNSSGSNGSGGSGCGGGGSSKGGGEQGAHGRGDALGKTRAWDDDRVRRRSYTTVGVGGGAGSDSAGGDHTAAGNMRGLPDRLRSQSVAQELRARSVGERDSPLHSNAPVPASPTAVKRTASPAREPSGSMLGGVEAQRAPAPPPVPAGPRRTSDEQSGGSEDGSSPGSVGSSSSSSVPPMLGKGKSLISLPNLNLFRRQRKSRKSMEECVVAGLERATLVTNAMQARPLKSSDFDVEWEVTLDTRRDSDVQQLATLDDDGAPITPECTFRTIAPLAFKIIRDEFCVASDAYLSTWASCELKGRANTGGRSGAFFFFTSDRRFILKTLTEPEVRVLRDVLPDYIKHVQRYEHTLLTRVYGLHSITHVDVGTVTFMVMGNLFYTPIKINRCYDLKGSTAARSVPTHKRRDSSTVLKDNDFVREEKYIRLGKQQKLMFMAQVENDTKLLVSHGIMDYSLLCGVHYVHGHRKDTLETLQEEPAASARHSLGLSSGDDDDLGPMWTLDEEHDDTTALESSSSSTSAAASSSSGTGSTAASSSTAGSEGVVMEPVHTDDLDTDMWTSVFQRDQGGLRGEGYGADKIYYLGVIDLLQTYTLSKATERALKSMIHKPKSISSTEPRAYAERFQKFLDRVVQ